MSQISSQLLQSKKNMKLVIQRVIQAKVVVQEEVISSINRGLCVLVGICQDDNNADVDYLCRKLLQLRVFDDESGKRWQKNVMDQNLEVLCVSQFTLYHRLKGNKPDFHNAMQGADAQNLYNSFLEKLGKSYLTEKIKDGKFGAMMEVHIINDGPVTLEIESPKQNKAQ
ncbi:DTD1 family protein [Megaselia abdita]